MSKPREKMAADLRLEGFRPNTQEAYLHCVRRFANHFGRSPDRLGEAEVRAFLDFLTCERKASPSTRRVYLGALKFLYCVTLGRPAAGARSARRPQRASAGAVGRVTADAGDLGTMASTFLSGACAVQRPRSRWGPRRTHRRPRHETPEPAPRRPRSAPGPFGRKALPAG